MDCPISLDFDMSIPRFHLILLQKDTDFRKSGCEVEEKSPRHTYASLCHSLRQQEKNHLEMLKALAHLFGLSQRSKKESNRKKGLDGAPLPLTCRSESKDISVRIVFAGGREERYECGIPASHLMDKYPGMCIARPEVFKNPKDSLLWPDENLLPGQKYIVIPSTTVRKLKLRHLSKLKAKGSAESKDEAADSNITMESVEDISDDSICSAIDFYVTRSRSSRSLATPKSAKPKKPFVPPLPMESICKGLTWEPSLTSVQELSP